MKYNYYFRMFVILFISSVAAVIWSCQDPSQPGDTYVKQEGILVDEQGFVIPNAIVEVVFNDKVLTSDTTDEEGYFSLDKVPSVYDRLTLKVYHSDFIPYTENLKGLYEKSENKEKIKIKILHDEDCCGIINITVKDKEGNALENVEVKLRRNMDVIRKGKTGSDGKINFENVCLGEYNLRIYKEGYLVVEQNINVESCDSPLSITYSLEAKPEDKDCCEGKAYIIVKDGNGKPVEKAAVRLWKDGKLLNTAETNAEGVALFIELCKGKYGVDIVKDGFKSIEWNFELECNKTAEFPKTLSKTECCDGVISFIVRDKEGNILPGAKIKILAEGRVVSDPVTNSEGKAGVDGLCEGTYRVVIAKEGYEAVEFSVEVKCHDKLTIEKALAAKDCCKGILTFIIRDKDGKPLKGAKVKLWKEANVVREILTNEEGKAVTDGICEGKYAISVHLEGYKVIEYAFEIKCNESLTIEKQLAAAEDCCKGVWKLYVKDKDGKPVAGAKVYLKQNGVIKSDPVTNADGYVAADGLCEGSYVVIVKKNDAVVLEYEFTLKCNETVQHEKQLNISVEECCQGRVKLILRDGEGKPVSGAKVKLFKNDQVVKEGVTDANGYFVWEGVCKGSYFMTIEKEGRDKLTQEFSIDCNATKVIEKNYASDCCKGAMKVIVRNSSNQPVAGATVKLYKGSTVVRTLTTNADGYVVSDGICEGAYTLVVLKDGYKAAEVNITILCSKTIEVEKQLVSDTDCCKGIVKIYPLDNDTKELIDGAVVNLWKDGKLFKTGKVENGTFVGFDGLCIGKYGVSITHDQYKSIEYSFELECNKTLTFEKFLSK